MGHAAERFVGTNAARVAYATNGLTIGTQWIESDTKAVLFWDGEKWQGGGGYVQLVSITDTDSPYSAGDESVIACDATGGNIVVNLPTAIGITGKTYIIKRIDGSGNTITVDGNGAETIDDNATQEINQYDALAIVSDGTEWWII